MSSPVFSPDGVQRVTFPHLKGARQRVAFLLCDTGDVNCLRPVVAAMLADPSCAWQPELLLIGVAATKSLDSASYEAEARLAVFTAWEDGQEPIVFVTSSSCSNQRMQLAVRAKYPRARMLYVEDNYGQGKKLFEALAATGRLLPQRFCCIDEGAVEDLLALHPKCSGRIYATGQPVFEAVLNEPPALRTEARATLGLKLDESFIVYMGSPDNGQLIQAFAGAFKHVRPWRRRPVLTVRRHPHDTTNEDGYRDLFDGTGIAYQNTSAISKTEIVARAADLVLAEVSTELTIAALRGISAAHLVDDRYATKKGRLPNPLPHTRAGAVGICRTVHQAAGLAFWLLDPQTAEDHRQVMRLQESRQRFRDSLPRNSVSSILGHIRALAASASS